MAENMLLPEPMRWSCVQRMVVQSPIWICPCLFMIFQMERIRTVFPRRMPAEVHHRRQVLWKESKRVQVVFWLMRTLPQRTFLCGMPLCGVSSVESRSRSRHLSPECGICMKKQEFPQFWLRAAAVPFSMWQIPLFRWTPIDRKTWRPKYRNYCRNIRRWILSAIQNHLYFRLKSVCLKWSERQNDMAEETGKNGSRQK